MADENEIRIVNVIAYIRLPARVDFYKTAAANPNLEYDEISKYAWLTTLSGNGRIALSSSGISVMGAKCEKEARNELQKVIDGRLKIFYAETLPQKKRIAERV